MCDMTIREYVENWTQAHWQDRLDRLRELDAPEILLVGVEQRVANPLGDVAKKSLEEFGDVIFSDVSEHTGLKGKLYLRFVDPEVEGDILCVASKWGGRYLYRQEVKDA